MKKKKPSLRSSPVPSSSSSSSLRRSTSTSTTSTAVFAYQSETTVKKVSNFASLIWTRSKTWQLLLLCLCLSLIVWFSWMTFLRILSHFLSTKQTLFGKQSVISWTSVGKAAGSISHQQQQYSFSQSSGKPNTAMTSLMESGSSIKSGGGSSGDGSSLRIIAISDTHNGHSHLTDELKSLYRSPSDVLIHCGDATNRGTESELSSINKWFGTLPFKRIIIVSGNMDGLGLDKGGIDGHKLFTNAIYLEDESINLDGLKLYGSPFTPKFVGGFQLLNSRQSQSEWSKIPLDTDILVTHGPPRGILDKSSSGFQVGDTELLSAISERDRIKVNVFGHVHESFGKIEQSMGKRMSKRTVSFINAAMYNGIYKSRAGVSPVVFTVPIPSTSDITMKTTSTESTVKTVGKTKRLSEVL